MKFKQYMNENKSIKSISISDDKAMSMTKKIMKNHKKLMERLKDA